MHWKRINWHNLLFDFGRFLISFFSSVLVSVLLPRFTVIHAAASTHDIVQTVCEKSFAGKTIFHFIRTACAQCFRSFDMNTEHYKQMHAAPFPPLSWNVTFCVSFQSYLHLVFHFGDDDACAHLVVNCSRDPQKCVFFSEFELNCVIFEPHKYIYWCGLIQCKTKIWKKVNVCFVCVFVLTGSSPISILFAIRSHDSR